MTNRRNRVSNDTKAYAFSLLTAALILGITLWRESQHKAEREEYPDTVRVTIVRHDTVRIAPVAPRDSIIIRYVRVRLPADTLVHRDTVCLTQADSTELTLPITQKRYEDSLYTAYVSGYMPSLDSIRLYRTRETTILTHTVREQSAPRRWGIGLQVGYGLTLSSEPRLRPYVGIGVSYNLFNF